MTVAQLTPVPAVVAERRAARLRARRSVLALAGLAVLLGLIYLVGFLLPLAYWRLPDVIVSERPLAVALGVEPAGSLFWIVPVLLAFLCYALAIWVARRISGRRALLATLAVGAVYAALFVPQNPVGAQDIYHNVFDGRILWMYGGNPNNIPPAAYPEDPLNPAVVAWAEFASVYGPVWYTVIGLPYLAGGDSLLANVIGHKLLTAAFLLGTALLAALAAERIRPGTGVMACVLVAWNPLMLFETAGNAHNDIVMMFFAVAAFYTLTRGWWLAVFPCLALAAATKYGVALLGPVMLVWMLRRPEIPRAAIAGSVVLGAIVGLAVYAPFLQGSVTLDIIRRQSGYNTSSPSALLDAVLMSWFHLSPTESSQIMKTIVVPPFLVLYAWQVWRSGGNFAALVARSFAVFFGLLLIATWWFWPWYVIWVVPLAALTPRRGVAILAAVFSASSMLMYAAYFWLLYGDGLRLQAATAGVAFLPPLLAVLGYLGWRGVQEARTRALIKMESMHFRGAA